MASITRRSRPSSRVAIGVRAESGTGHGHAPWSVVRGTARITEGGGPELLQELAHVYLGPNVRFPSADDPPPGRVVHISVERISGVGPWAPAS